MNSDYPRGTGRTTRLLKEAIEKAESGQTVIIVYANTMHRNHMRTLLYRLLPNPDGVSSSAPQQKIMFPNAGNIQFIPADHQEIDWHGVRVKGYPTHVPMLVDHYTVEQNRKLIQENGGNVGQLLTKYEQ